MSPSPARGKAVLDINVVTGANITTAMSVARGIFSILRNTSTLAASLAVSGIGGLVVQRPRVSFLHP